MLAFEFTKRKFSKTYGKELPVWALLASGSTGGVRSRQIFHSHAVPHDCLLDRILARLLPPGYVDIKFHATRYSPQFIRRCCEITYSTAADSANRNACAIYRK